MVVPRGWLRGVALIWLGVPTGALAQTGAATSDTCLRLEDFGGAPNGALPRPDGVAGAWPTDNLAAFQAAVAVAVTTGQQICLRAGTYYTSGSWKIDATGAAPENGLVPGIQGAGMNATYIAGRNGGSFNVLEFDGTIHAGIGVELKDFTVRKGGYYETTTAPGAAQQVRPYGDLTGTCVEITDAPHIVIRNVRAENCLVGGFFLGVQEALFENPLFMFNMFGMKMAVNPAATDPTTTSRPNEILFLHPKFGANYNNGFDITNPSTVTMINPAIVGTSPQGHTGIDPAQQWGGRFTFNDATAEGTAGATLISPYVENNVGPSIWYQNAMTPSTFTVMGGSFQKHANDMAPLFGTQTTSYPRIRFDTSGDKGQALILSGNGFRSVFSGSSDYTPSPSRPDVQIVNPDDGGLQVSETGDIHADRQEDPRLVSTLGLVKIGGPTTVSALPACDAAATGALATVIDARSPRYGGPVRGGGEVATPAFCNGSAWVAH